jgi:hypothetical protein
MVRRLYRVTASGLISALIVVGTCSSVAQPGPEPVASAPPAGGAVAPCPPLPRTPRMWLGFEPAMGLARAERHAASQVMPIRRALGRIACDARRLAVQPPLRVTRIEFTNTVPSAALARVQVDSATGPREVRLGVRRRGERWHVAASDLHMLR